MQISSQESLPLPQGKQGYTEGRVDTARRQREFDIVSMLSQSGSQAGNETCTSLGSLHCFTRCTLFYSVHSAANHLHNLLCSTTKRVMNFKDMPASTPTLNPCAISMAHFPIKREGLQNAESLPFPHFGGKGLGDGGMVINSALITTPLQTWRCAALHIISPNRIIFCGRHDEG